MVCALLSASCSDEGPASTGDADAADVAVAPDAIVEDTPEAETVVDVTSGPDADAPDAVPADLSGDDAAQVDTAAQDTSEDVVAPPTPITDERPRGVRRVSERNFLWLATAQDNAIGHDGTTWVWLDPAGETELPDGPAIDATPTAYAVAAAPIGGLLLGGPHGLARVDRDGFLWNPLEDRFASEPIRDLAEDPRDGAVWIATEQGLYRWAGDTLTPLEPAPGSGLNLAGSRLAFSPGRRTLWARSDSGLVAVVARGASFEAFVVAAEPEAGGAVVVDASGDVFLADDGGLFRVSADAVTTGAPLLGLALPEGVAALVGHPSSPSAWFSLQSGALHRHVAGALRRSTDLPEDVTNPNWLAATPDGRVLVATQAGLFEIQPERALALDGALAGATLGEATTLRIRVTDPEDVTGVVASLRMDGEAPTPVDVVAPSADAPGRLTLEPAALPNADYRLEVAVTWADGETRTEAFAFRVAFPTWAEVRVVHETFCGGCHGPTGRQDLSTSALWRAQMDEILCRVDRLGVDRAALPECEPFGEFLPAPMPRGDALDPETVGALRQWRDGGFRE